MTGRPSSSTLHAADRRKRHVYWDAPDQPACWFPALTESAGRVRSQTMSVDATIEILNELLDQQSRSTLPRLGESEVFFTRASADERIAVQRMIDEDVEHRAWLVDAIIDLGGNPLPVRASIHSSNIHYLDLDYLLPAVHDDRKGIVAAYESAASQVGANPRAAEVIAKIATRLKRHIEQLNSEFRTHNSTR